MANNSLNEIGEVLKTAKNVYLFPHINADGDALGSCAALCKAIRSFGVPCHVLVEDKIADNLAFLDHDYTVMVTGADTFNGETPDVCVAVDNGEVERFPLRKSIFEAGATSVCIDHHPTSKPFADYNYIDPAAAATGEIIFDLITAMSVTIDSEMGAALFAAITTDCGNFQYSNTTKRTFEIATALMDSNFNLSEVSNTIYQNNPPERIRIETDILKTMDIFADGKAALAYVTQSMLDAAGARMEHTEGIINTLRGIAGVEVAVLLKEHDNGKVKVSMRAKSYADVSAICQRHSGGGHVRAAGCTLECTIPEAINIIKSDITSAL